MTHCKSGRRAHYLNALAISSTLIFQLPASISANQGAPPPSTQFQVLPLLAVPQLVLPPTDVSAELAKSPPGMIPLRYAVPLPVQASAATDGTWEAVPSGRLWRLRVNSSGATDLNIGFTNLYLPEGAMLYIEAESQPYYQGPYTAGDVQVDGQLWTPVVPGDSAVIELFVPAGAPDARLALTQVGAGFRDLFHQNGIPKAENCEIDVVCPSAAPWANEIRSVCRISIGGSILCTATLIMDAPADFRPFLLTANHCTIDSGNAASVVAYWNYQSPTCGQFGLGGSLAQNTSGTTFRASKTDVDFCLVELNNLPSAAYNVYYAGWDRSGAAAAGAVGIHHPNGDGKCISFSSNPLTTVTSCIGSGGVNTHWQVIWSAGVTEPGSSGSGIWNPANHLLLGTLSGGGSDCTTPTSPDCYGKFSVSWASGASPSSRLSDWLDPAGAGLTTKAGANPPPILIRPAATSIVAEGCYPGNGAIDPGETVTVNFGLKNNGSRATTNLVATLQAGGGVTAPGPAQNYGALPADGTTVSRSFYFTASGSCGGTISPALQLQDGTSNLGTAAFTFTLGRPIVTFTQNFDSVAAPALPAGWSSPSSLWVTSTAQRDTVPNSAFTADPATVTDRQLVSPVIPITTSQALVTFRHSYNTEAGFDGGALEIAIGGGAFNDIITAGGSFVTGGYDTTLPTTYNNPLGNRDAWSGNSGGFKTIVAMIPPSAAGHNIQLRWRFGSDNSNAGAGWYVDTITVSDGYACCVGSAISPTLSTANYRTNTFQFTVTGTAGYPYAVEGTTNFTTWLRLKTNFSPFVFIDTNAPAFPYRFYRATFQP